MTYARIEEVSVLENGTGKTSDGYLFRGNLSDCFQHFRGEVLKYYPKGSRDAYSGRRQLSEFCGVTPHTVSDWLLAKEVEFEGDKWFRVGFFLQIQGYDVTDLDRLGDLFRNYAALFVFGIVKPEEAKAPLGYANLKNLYRVLRGGSALPEQKRQLMWDIWKTRRNDLEGKIQEAREKFRMDIFPKVETRVESQDFPKRKTEKMETPRGEPFEDNIAGLLGIMTGLNRILDTKPFDKLSSGDLATLAREYGKTVLHLYEHVFDLVRLMKDTEGDQNA